MEAALRTVYEIVIKEELKNLDLRKSGVLRSKRSHYRY